MTDEIQLRQRLAKLFGRLGSDQAGERVAAVAAIDNALNRAGKSWTWIADLVGRGELPDWIGGRGAVFTRLMKERVAECFVGAWAHTVEEAAVMRKVKLALDGESGLRGLTDEELEHGLAICDSVRKRVGRR